MLMSGMASRSNLTVWTFQAVDGARRALEHLRGEERIDGAAVISWTPGWNEPETREFYSVDSTVRTKRFWSEFFQPVFYAREQTSEFFVELGVDDELLAEVRDALTPGTSSLLLLTSGVASDDLETALHGFDAKLVHTTFPTKRRPTRTRLARRTDRTRAGVSARGS
jgi:uncharacterized membrane protein